MGNNKKTGKKRLNLPLADPGMSNAHMKLVKKNEQLLKRLRKMKKGPLSSLREWTRRNK
ncbi:hypothetical protein [Oceanobacillus piezotolerans]|nr:hypothetical protein [Oceanobacillus piezotolerans]